MFSLELEVCRVQNKWQGLYARIVTRRKTSLLDGTPLDSLRRQSVFGQQKSAPCNGARCVLGKGSHGLPEGVDRVNRTLGESKYGLTEVLVALHLAGGCGQQFFGCFAFFRITGHTDADTKLHHRARAH